MIPDGTVDPSAGPFPRSRALAVGLEAIESIESTNAELARRERIAPQPHFTALATLDQTAGRGRLDRTWTAAPDSALAVSVVVRPESIPVDRLGLLTLLAGLAARNAVAGMLPLRDVALKWPNDVLVDGRKITGVLAELVPQTGAIIVGVGINTAMTESQLPVPTATSIAIEAGATQDPRTLADAVLTEFLAGFAGLVARFELARGDIDRVGLRDELEAACGTLGERVSVELPGGTVLVGTALGLGPEGSLLVAAGESAVPTVVLAGDVTHLRYQ